MAIFEKEHPTGGYWMEVNEQEGTARLSPHNPFRPVREIFDQFMPDAVNGEDYAFNICYILEGYLNDAS